MKNHYVRGIKIDYNISIFSLGDTYMRWCSRCEKHKDDSEFYKSYLGYCKECKIQLSRERYAPVKAAIRLEKESAYRDGLKKCTKCGVFKSLEEYRFRKTSSWDGLYQICKDCEKKRSNEHYQTIKGHHTEKSREWYIENREGKLRKNREWRRNNPDASHAIWHRYKSRKAGVGGSFTSEEWKTLCDYYSPDGSCLCCGKKGVLHKDHVVPIARGGENTIRNIQPLCRSCNSKKGDERLTDYRPDGGEFARKINSENIRTSSD